MRNYVKIKTRQIIRCMLQWVKVIFIAIILAILLRLFLFDTYLIPTPSMEPAIFSGDYVVVNRLVPGPRIFCNLSSIRKGEKPRFARFPGFAVKRKDILIFNFPYADHNYLDIDLNLYYAKRCVAIPGDTFCIENGFYRVKNVEDTLGHYLTQNRLSKQKNVEYDSNILGSFLFNWTVKNFGPLYVPKAGDQLNIDTINSILYYKLIAYETQKNVHTTNGQVMIGDSVIDKYRFEKNYYFMAGDNLFVSEDSRYWGLLPEDHITGKVSFVWNTRNMNTGKKHWDRFMKKIE